MPQNLCINRNRTQPHGGTSTKGGKCISRAVNNKHIRENRHRIVLAKTLIVGAKICLG